MIKKTYYLENSAKLRLSLNQICIEQGTKDNTISRDLDDAGFIILDHPEINISIPLLQACLEKNITLAVCNSKHLPIGLWLPLEGHTESGGRMRAQIESTKPLRKKLWQITVSAKVKNQGLLLKSLNLPYQTLLNAASKIRSGDSTNIEATAAAYYWKQLFKDNVLFYRDRFGEPPNPLLNYCYAILRSQVSKSLIGSGLFPFYGIHHKNRYNSFCLSDDIMEPFRPYADALIKNLITNDPNILEEFELSKAVRSSCLGLLNLDVVLDKKKKPLQLAVQSVCSRLAECFETQNHKALIYPEYE